LGPPVELRMTVESFERGLSEKDKDFTPADDVGGTDESGDRNADELDLRGALKIDASGNTPRRAQHIGDSIPSGQTESVTT
jgi:hypothetical protein